MAPLYDMSIPLFIAYLENMKTFLKKGEDWAKENNVPVEKLLEGKLADDMKPLPFHIQACSNSAKFVLVRVGGVPNVVMEDNETAFAQLYERIDRTLEFLQQGKAETFEGKEGAEIAFGPENKFKMDGKAYLQKFAVPNFFFHVTTAYAILRNQGVPVGKWDYLGKIA